MSTFTKEMVEGETPSQVFFVNFTKVFIIDIHPKTSEPRLLKSIVILAFSSSVYFAFRNIIYLLITHTQ